MAPYRGYTPARSPPPGAVNVPHLSLMTYQLVMGLQPGVRSIVDLPCDATAAWMPSVLARLVDEVPALFYTCVWAGGGRAAREGVPAAALALSWGGFPGWSHRAVWRFFRALPPSHNTRGQPAAPRRTHFGTSPRSPSPPARPLH